MAQINIEDEGHQRKLHARILNGGIAGIVGVTCTFPLDLVKTRLQNQTRAADGKLLYRSAFDCFSKVIRKEGFFGMYKGSAVNLLLIMPEKAIKLTANDTLRNKMSKGGKLSPIQEVSAGAGAGFCQVIITTPMEMLKIHGQDSGRVAEQSLVTTGGKSIQSKSTLAVTKHLLRTKGFFGLYKGIGATLLRDIPFSIIYFPLFSHLKALGDQLSIDGLPAFYVDLVCGATSGAVAAVSVNPCDVVKTRLQTLTIHTQDRQYNGIVDCVRRIYKEEGMRSFFRGALPRAMVIAPLFGIAQSIYLLGIGERILGINHLHHV